MAHLDGVSVQTLGEELNGDLIPPGVAIYETSRLAWNDEIDRHPALLRRSSFTCNRST
jgi:hypothetical protein